VAVNQCIVELLQTEQGLGKRFVLTIDASFIAKSGHATPELGKYWNSKQGKAIRGLEVSCCALIDPEQKYALPLQVAQTPATFQDNETRLDHYAKQRAGVLTSLTANLNQQIVYGCVIQ
jgi:hypothetical protein